VLFARIAEDGATPGTVLLALVGALGREDFQKLVEVVDRGRCEDHRSSPALSGAAMARLTIRMVSARPGPHMGWIPYAVTFPSERARAPARKGQPPPGWRHRSWNR